LAKIRWKKTPTQIKRQIIQPAFEATAVRFGELNREAMEQPVYDFDRPTRRRETPTPGAVVTSPRTITDTGELADSLVIDDIRLFRFLFRWQASYASRVFAGFKRKDGTGAPPRDWIVVALSLKPLAEVFAEEIRRRV
jgi:hypothetical protein